VNNSKKELTLLNNSQKRVNPPELFTKKELTLLNYSQKRVNPPE
jgi:hypothetical protein